MNHMNPPNGQNSYKPIPPPKPKNYKPPYKGQGSYGPGDGMMQPALPYQHGKSHSNPVVSTFYKNNKLLSLKYNS